MFMVRSENTWSNDYVFATAMGGYFVTIVKVSSLTSEGIRSAASRIPTRHFLEGLLGNAGSAFRRLKLHGLISEESREAIDRAESPEI
jgi:hypothetical protein